MSSTDDGPQTQRAQTAQTARIPYEDTVFGIIQVNSKGPLDDVAVTRGSLLIDSDHMQQHSDRARAIYVTGGRIEIGGAWFTPHDGLPQQRGAEFVSQGQVGILDVDGAVFPLLEGDSGVAAAVRTE